MVGVLIDLKVLLKLVEIEFDYLTRKFSNIGFEPSALFVQWFICIFTYNMPETVN